MRSLIVCSCVSSKNNEKSKLALNTCELGTWLGALCCFPIREVEGKSIFVTGAFCWQRDLNSLLPSVPDSAKAEFVLPKNTLKDPQELQRTPAVRHCHCPPPGIALKNSRCSFLGGVCHQSCKPSRSCGWCCEIRNWR